VEDVCARTELDYVIETGGHLQTQPGQDEAFRGHIPALDGVRGVAAAMIFVYHYGGGAQSSFLLLRTIGNALHFGWVGVSLFFVLSGFLISGILWDGYRKPGWWRRFYLRRSLRIFPLYYLALVVAAVIWLALGVPAVRLSFLWIYALYLQDAPFFNAQLANPPAGVEMVHFWSLAVEEQFYLVWPFLLALFAGKRRRAIHLILTLWVGSLAFRVAMLGLNGEGWSSYFLFGRAGELLAGAYLAMAVRGDSCERERIFRSLPYILGCSLLFLVLIGFASPSLEISTSWWSTAGLAVLSIFFASVIGLSLKPGVVQSVFQTPVLRWLGKISYGIYVYHLLLHPGFLWLVQRMAPNLGSNARAGLIFVVALAGTLGVASLSFYTYESAFLRWKERIGH
jgi:peptidoglycan/LPS O-acetylase OafA/YrhL